MLRAAEPDRQADLDAIRRQIRALEEQLAKIDQESSGLEAELRRTETEVRLQEEQLAEARAERSLAEAAVLESEERTVELEGKLLRARAGLRGRLAELYRFDESAFLRSFLGTEGGRTLEELRLLRLLTRREAFWVNRYLETREELRLERFRLESRRLEVEAAAEREQERLRRLNRTRTVQRRALEVMRARREGVAQQASDLLDKGERLSLLLSILSGRAETPPDGIAIQSFEGVLDWPVRGEIVQGFGLRSEARYNTKIPHNGVEIEAPRESEVIVVFPGVVVFSAPFEDFGMTVVVHHPDRVFSLYAGLETAGVDKGDVLSFSDVVGVTRSKLYFEIRVDNRPQDPMEWLR